MCIVHTVYCSVYCILYSVKSYSNIQYPHSKTNTTYILITITRVSCKLYRVYTTDSSAATRTDLAEYHAEVI